jgi:hypothetical protein
MPAPKVFTPVFLPHSFPSSPISCALPPQTTDVHDYVKTLDDNALGEMSSALGFALTSEQIVAKVQGNLNQLGLAFIMVLVLQLALFVVTCLFLWALKAAHLTGAGPGNVAGGGGHAGPMILTDNRHGGKAPRAGKQGSKV